MVAAQLPQWADLPVRPVARSGWDNRTFHLGEELLVRLPSAAEYAGQVKKEQRWLPKLATFLPLPIPVPIAVGEPAESYPWAWSVYRWLEGEPASTAQISDLCDFATSLAQFLTALQGIDTMDGPQPGLHSFFRGGPLKTYDVETRQALSVLKGEIDIGAAAAVWDTALAAAWHGPQVWVHGDISAGNLLVEKGRLSAVIDFGQLTVGDPACDLAIAWTFFQGESREIFRIRLPFDTGTWSRARGWALWKALIVRAGFTNPNNLESEQCGRIIEEVLEDRRDEALG